jgi:CRP/FNR family cyclic AMP-dependent transcriptional regulator
MDHLHAYAQIDAYVDRCIVITPEERALFHDVLEQRTVQRKQYLLRAGEICRYEYYVISGCLRSYYLDEKGNEVNIMFPVEDWWLGDMISFTNNTPSSLYIEALEDCTLWMINQENKELLFEKAPAFERMFRLMIQRSLAALQNRLYATIAKTAEQRYQEFMEKYPDIPQRIPQHYIASYLGITPEFLSKIRRKMAS